MDSQVRDSHVKEEETPLDRSECPQKKWRLFNGSKALDSLKEERHKLTSRVTKMRNLQQTFYLNPSQKKKSPSCKRASRTLQTSALAFKHNLRSHSRPMPSSNRHNSSQSNNSRSIPNGENSTSRGRSTQWSVVGASNRLGWEVVAQTGIGQRLEEVE